jgi:hypothetical protein
MRHSRESGNLVAYKFLIYKVPEVPAFAGMTVIDAFGRGFESLKPHTANSATTGA